MRLESLIREDIPIVDKNDSLYHAFKLIEKTGIDKVIVTENRVLKPGKEVKELAGILTSRDIVQKIATQRMRQTTPGKLHVSSFISINPAFITIDSSLLDVFKLMVDKGYGILPVLDKEGNIMGGILRDTLLRVAEKDDTEIRHIMDTNPLIARTTDRILKIRQDMLSNDISFMPVVDENDELVGYITIYEVAYSLMRFQDIVPAKYRKERISHLIVEDVMRFRPPKLRIINTVSEAVISIMKKNSRGAVVVDEIGRIAGVVTPHIILKHIYTNKKELIEELS
ncbi:CBS domain containing protein [Staphylothermus marinus F1]|uniref:CBS domain containing protein n=1 Tax=Staphylothermus marinus (strain ATCC 43588 / DSM 3639 / JCM 9404 / F1) TaxID=399550 RepID=A3DP38_STAMF|nr:CBS domain-containing protein [Staphylothermus marinus]ABN70398.1 CBS domain containing protein [Staphylothermus marinus F1]